MVFGFLACLFLPAASCKEGEREGRYTTISWEEANKHYGEYCSVEGRVVSTHLTAGTCFLNFDAEWQKSLTAVIYPSSLKSFPDQPETIYIGKFVRIFGQIIEHQAKPTIILRDPDQIEIIPEDSVDVVTPMTGE